jgi:hypothetical protein
MAAEFTTYNRIIGVPSSPAEDSCPSSCAPALVGCSACGFVCRRPRDLVDYIVLFYFSLQGQTGPIAELDFCRKYKKGAHVCSPFHFASFTFEPSLLEQPIGTCRENPTSTIPSAFHRIRRAREQTSCLRSECQLAYSSRRRFSSRQQRCYSMRRADQRLSPRS